MPKKEDWNVEDEEDLGTGQPAVNAPLNAPAPGGKVESPYRKTASPAPDATHAGIEDAGGVKSETITADFGRDFPALFDEKFPDDLKKSYAILRAVRALPEYTRKQAKERARREGLISAHIRKISNASPVVEIQADEQAVAQKNHGAIMKRQRLVSMAQHDVHVRELLTDRDNLADKVNDLNGKLVEAQAQVISLQTENAALKQSN
jgi:hypothetical protein